MSVIRKMPVDHANGDERSFNLDDDGFVKLQRESDYLLILSLPGNYDPGGKQFAIVKYLLDKGVVLSQAFDRRELDLRPHMPVWVSARLSGVNFKRLVVLECLPEQLTGKELWMAYEAMRVFSGRTSPYTATSAMLAGIDSEQPEFGHVLRMSLFASASCSARAPLTATYLLVDENQAAVATPLFDQLAGHYADPPIESPEVAKALEGLSFPSVKVEMPAYPGLTERHIKAILAYTNDSYYGINSALRLNDVTAPYYQHWQPLIEALSTGLAALPIHSAGDENRLYRAMSRFEGFEDAYILNKVSQELAFTSTSQKRLGFHRGVLFELTSLTGKDISSFSSFPGEDEVLFDFDLRHLLHKWVESATDPKDHITTEQWLPNESGARYLHL